MATGTLKIDSRYSGTVERSFQCIFVGKATNGRTGYYGSVCLPYDVSNGTLTLSDFIVYVAWYSDGASHTLDLDNATLTSGIDVMGNVIWITIPANNISSANSICVLRLQFHYRVS